MREIKFKAWDPVARVMHKEVSVPTLEGWIPLQYTGLKDKNGKEIFEGDIIEGHDGYRWTVGFKDGGFGFESPSYGWVAFAWNRHARMNANELPVVGNIYENPDLLRV